MSTWNSLYLRWGIRSENWRSTSVKSLKKQTLIWKYSKLCVCVFVCARVCVPSGPSSGDRVEFMPYLLGTVCVVGTDNRVPRRFHRKSVRACLKKLFRRLLQITSLFVCKWNYVFVWHHRRGELAWQLYVNSIALFVFRRLLGEDAGLRPFFLADAAFFGLHFIAFLPCSRYTKN